jgi:protease-4
MSEPFPPPSSQDPRQTQYQAAFPPYAYGVPAAYAPRRSAWPWVVLILGVIALGLIAMSVFFASLARTIGMDSDSGSGSFATDSIAVIDVSGVITDADTDKIDKQLEKYGDNDNIKAILLHIDSPGGGAAASQEIYHEVMRIREQKHKKIVASVESVGTISLQRATRFTRIRRRWWDRLA